MRKAVLGIDAAALARCQEKARGGHHLSGHWEEHGPWDGRHRQVVPDLGERTAQTFLPAKDGR